MSCEWSTFKYINFVIVHFIHAYLYSSITCQQNDYLSINGHHKTKETSKFKKIVKEWGLKDIHNSPKSL